MSECHIFPWPFLTIDMPFPVLFLCAPINNIKIPLSTTVLKKNSTF